ncbi:hypothetical protein [Massilia sp. Leaf139]|uniref:hypothetical protein n=1 Tax=Massilia sp. Leaf139 TaxID=1736272 RepID=UPI0006FF8301|nr:hypothetical protein [Massilia sp. Leaf139]KQQ96691.1 hypothetical protein ASF77_01445 [Massilia sp. Leaf139]
MSIVEQAVNPAGATLSRSCRACAFFHLEEEAYRVRMPFDKEAFERGVRAFHVADPAPQLAHLTGLEQDGIDAATAQAPGERIVGGILRNHPFHVAAPQPPQLLQALRVRQAGVGAVTVAV